MKLFVTAKAGARKECVERIDSTHYVVAVREQAEKKKANAAIQKALAAHLGIPAFQLHLRSGATSRRKVFDIETV